MDENHLECIYKLNQLVGRETILSEIHDNILSAPEGPQILFLVGKGGAGKTRIAEYLINEADVPWRSVSRLVDFYDVLNHSASGLASSIYDALFPDDSPPACFSKFRKLRRELIRQQAAGGSYLEQQRQRALRAFAENMKAFTESHRVLIALDTVEKLIYQQDEITGKIINVADSWDWLNRSLNDWGNVSVLVVGRPQSEKLIDSESIHKIDLPFLDEKGSLAYFEAVERACEKENKDLADRIRGLSKRNRLKAHELAGGRPIMLALLVDFLSVGDKGGELQKVLEQESKKENLEELLITRLSALSSVGDTILALGRAPKGINRELLARLLDIEINEADKKLDEVRKFSFVKMPFDGDRVFLHDEFYSMLQNRVYNSPHDIPQAVAARDIIIDYVIGEIKALEDTLTSLYKEVDAWGTSRIKKILDSIIETYNKKQNALSELIFYLLRQDAARGFRYYYRFVCEASNGLDVSLDVWLQAEMSSYLSEMKAYDETGGFSRLFAEAVLEIQVINRLWNAGQTPEAEQKAEIFLDKKEDLVGENGLVGLLAALQNWEAYKKIRAGDLKEANRLLTDNTKKLKKYLNENKEIDVRSNVHLWYATIAYGYAHWVLGFLKRNQGLMNDAIALYRKAIIYLRDVNIDIFLAGVLNDQGFALCESGNWRAAKPLVLEGLEKRQNLGALVPVGRSLNTLGIVERYEGSYHLAVQYSEKARRIFEAANDTYGQGLALVAAAESYQRLANELGNEPESSLKEKIKNYQKAIQYAQKAVRIFESGGDRLRQAEASKELGCAYRNLTFYARQFPEMVKEEADVLVQKSRAALEDTVKLSENDRFRKLEAEINKAFLGFYSGDDALYSEAIKKANALIPNEYHLEDTAHSKAQQKPLFWAQLGKLNILLGRHAAEKENNFSLALDYFSKALELNSKYSVNYPGMLRAENLIYDRLKIKSSKELMAVCNQVKAFEDTHELCGKSFMRQFLVSRSLWIED